MKALNKGSKVNLAVIGVVLTIIIAFAVNREWITLDNIKESLAIIGLALGFFYKHFESKEYKAERDELKQANKRLLNDIKDAV